MRAFQDAEYDYGLEPGERFEPLDLDDEPFDLTRPHVMTALGPVDPDALGFTLHHEHVICNPPGAEPDLVLDDIVNAVAELEGYSVTGGRAIVDLTTADYGRAIGDILWVAQRVPVHIVLATGHREHRYAAPLLGELSIEEIAQRIIRELTVGIDATDAKAGVIAAGTSLHEITPPEERVLRAAARASLVTGVPISTHTGRGTMALEQIALLSEEGVDPARVTLGQLDHTLDEAYLRQVLESGVFVSFDHWTRPTHAMDADRAAMVKQLSDAGFGDRILLSGDFARRSDWLSYGGGPGFVHLLDSVPLALMDAGLDAPGVRRLFIDNPARALTIDRSSIH